MRTSPHSPESRPNADRSQTTSRHAGANVAAWTIEPVEIMRSKLKLGTPAVDAAPVRTVGDPVIYAPVSGRDWNCARCYKLGLIARGRHDNPQTIGVIGAGTMGSGIAQVGALSGLSVVMLDVDEKRVAKGRDAIAGGLERLVERRQRSSAPPRSPRARRALAACAAPPITARWARATSSSKAATEDEALKLKILRQVDGLRRTTPSSRPTPRRSRSPSSPRP